MNETITENYSLYNGDCVDVYSQLPDNSVHLHVFSPPFANLYIYSDDLRDMGNCKDTDAFFAQMDFLSPHLYRTLMPGRMMAVHCKQLAKYKGRDGASGWIDFRGDLIRHYEKHGFQYHSEVVIWTDPVLEMQKTKTQRLLYCQLRRDASLTGIGMPEYVLLFRKWEKDGDEHEKIEHFRDADEAEAAGKSPLQAFDLDTWQKYASPVWFDIRRTDVLNARIAREDKDEKHICPLQLEVIRRVVKLWSNPGDIVSSPFGGIGSEPYVALEQGRRAIAAELKPAYYAQMVKHCEEICAQKNAPTLFDFAGADDE
ncbi:MAG: DNA methyltransferase [Ruthenibacterium sp.]